jgi:pyrroline-5-carboxylate reductase
MSFDDKTVTFIGSGNMGEAMIKGLLDKKTVEPAQIIASDIYAPRGEELRGKYGIQVTQDNVEAAEKADLLVLSIKPQALDQVLPEARRGAHNCELILSIMAGVRIERIANGLANASVVRAMPNTPAQVGEGITVWTATKDVGEAQLTQARALLGAFGQEIYMDGEHYLDMATALSGTGPAYIFMFMEAMIDAGVHMGFSRRDAERLVMQTIRGSIAYAEASGLHPAELRNQVTSPAGTTAEALYHMEKGGFRTVISRAIWSAYQRSVQLGGGPPPRDLNGED